MMRRYQILPNTQQETGRCRSVLVFPDEEELRVGDPAVLVHVQLGHAAHRCRNLHNCFKDNLEGGTLRFIDYLLSSDKTPGNRVLRPTFSWSVRSDITAIISSVGFNMIQYCGSQS